LCAAILDRRDTVPAPPFSTAVNITRMGSASDAFGVRNVPVYQEDLMRVLHEALGIGLRDAYELVRTLGNPLSPTVVRAREAFFSVQPPEPLSPREWNRLWDRFVEECPYAVCKANYVATAHHCLQAAYLKAHHPAEFRAVLQVLHAKGAMPGHPELPLSHATSRSAR
jgi:hypothetical protein